MTKTRGIVKGVIPAVVTPLTNQGTFNDKPVRMLCDFLINRRVNGIFVLGTTGEGLLFSTRERMLIAKTFVECVDKRIAVIVHVGAMSTREAIELAQNSADIGADAVAVVAPPFFPLDTAALAEHFVSVARAVPDLPVYLYNIPSLSMNHISENCVKEVLERVDNVVGIKDTSGSLLTTQQYLHLQSANFDVLEGADALDGAALAIGAVGIVSMNSSALPEPFVALYEASSLGDMEKLRKYQKEIDKVREALLGGASIAAIKYAAELRGIPVGGVRRPLRSLDRKEREAVEQALNELLREPTYG